jgi:hypothetical protein
VSLGQGVAQAAYTLARQAAVEMLESGTYNAVADAAPFSEINGVFPRVGH